MRDQYAGDISDVLKFAFLRALAQDDKTLGIAWYYAPGEDGRSDGRHTEWRSDMRWRGLDEKLYCGLLTIPARTIAALEDADIWPKGTLFHREPMPPRRERYDWGLRKRAALDRAQIVFLDPDNGIGDETGKHATLSEIQMLRRPSRSIAFITFPGRTMPHNDLLKRLHRQLMVKTGAEIVLTLRTSVSVPCISRLRACVPRLRWFTLIDPDATLIKRTEEFVGKLSSIAHVRARLDRTG